MEGDNSALMISLWARELADSWLAEPAANGIFLLLTLDPEATDTDPTEIGAEGVRTS